MTSPTSNIGLKTYNSITDGSSLVFNYINDVSGSDLTSNLSIIDNWAGEVSASMAVVTAAEYVVISPNGVLTNEKTLQNGVASIISSTASAVALDVRIATPLQVSTGSATEAVISANSLSSSNYGKRSVSIPLNTTVALTGTESNYVSIPSSMDGWNLIEVAASSGSSSSGSPVFLVKACPKTAISGSQNMLTTNPVIGQLAYDSNSGSKLGSVSGVVNPSVSRVSAGDKIWVYSASASTCGSQVLWSQVSLTFQKVQ